MKVFKSILAVTLVLAFTVPPSPEATTNRPRNNARRMVALGTLKPSPVQTNIEVGV